MKYNSKCERCVLHESATYNRCVKGKGNPKAKLMLIGEAPGIEEDRQGIPFVGQAGQLLDHILRKLSIDPKDVFITNCLRCRPPKNKLPAKKQLMECWAACLGYLKEEIKTVKPDVILLMGNTPLQLLANKNFISKWSGMEVGKHLVVTHKSKRRKKLNLPGNCGFYSHLYASYHPAAALRLPKLEASIATAIYVAAVAAGMKPKPIGEESGMFDYEIRS